MRFDFLNDAPPDAFDKLRSLRIPEHLRSPLAALCTVIVVVAAWWGVEHYWIALARAEEANATVRLAQSRTDLAKTKLQRSHLEEMIDLDKRLQAIHLSGSELSVRLVDIADHVPLHAWLTSITRGSSGMQIDGRAQGLDVLSETVADLMSSHTVVSPSLVHAGKDDHSHLPNLLSFEVRVEDRTP